MRKKTLIHILKSSVRLIYILVQFLSFEAWKTKFLNRKGAGVGGGGGEGVGRTTGFRRGYRVYQINHDALRATYKHSNLIRSLNQAATGRKVPVQVFMIFYRDILSLNQAATRRKVRVQVFMIFI